MLRCLPVAVLLLLTVNVNARACSRTSPWNEYARMERVGGGLHAAVYKARRLSDGLIVAIKENNPHYRSDVLGEAQTMQKYQHPNLRKFIACFDDPKGNAYIVMELLRSSVWQQFQSRERPWPEAVFRQIVSDAMRGLHFLHSQNVRHGDLHLGNIMLDFSGGAKIADFTFVSALDYWSRRRETIRLCDLAVQFATGDPYAWAYDGASVVRAHGSPELKEFIEKCDDDASPTTAKLLETAFVSHNKAAPTTKDPGVPVCSCEVAERCSSRRLDADQCWASCRNDLVDYIYLADWERVQKYFASDVDIHADFAAVEQCVRNNVTGL